MSYEQFERAQKQKTDFRRNLFQDLNRASNKQPKYSDSSSSFSESSESSESESQIPKFTPLPISESTSAFTPNTAEIQQEK